MPKLSKKMGRYAGAVTQTLGLVLGPQLIILDPTQSIPSSSDPTTFGNVSLASETELYLIPTTAKTIIIRQAHASLSADDMNGERWLKAAQVGLAIGLYGLGTPPNFITELYFDASSGPGAATDDTLLGEEGYSPVPYWSGITATQKHDFVLNIGLWTASHKPLYITLGLDASVQNLDTGTAHIIDTYAVALLELE